MDLFYNSNQREKNNTKIYGKSFKNKGFGFFFILRKVKKSFL